MTKPKAKTKPLARLKDTSRGAIKHVEIHPAKNSAGGLGFITRVHRHPPKAMLDKMAAGGPYVSSPEPEETVHEDGQDMLDHVGKTMGVQPEAPDDGDGDEG